MQKVLEIPFCTSGSILLTSVLQAPWSLGKFGPLINGIAIVYSTWMAIFMVFPTSLPVTGSNMNVSALRTHVFSRAMAAVGMFADTGLE